ncbi:unnamed protein product [Miscanthus lutarioriparius]|uniref:Uncharacterized protein n=1 Tax=Miscanthus lutarioriparius TaxID=422564 RepID=A0A811S0R1_9POAL|nr:unnamed protein product [Miscanthus lutarioriparius]
MASRGTLLPLFLFLLVAPVLATSGTIVFTTLGRSRYAFDIFVLPLAPLSPSTVAAEIRLTDGASVNYNSNFAPSSSSELPSLLFAKTDRRGSRDFWVLVAEWIRSSLTGGNKLNPLAGDLKLCLFVSERNGSEVLEEADYSPTLTQLLPWDPIALKDRPSLTPDGAHLVIAFVGLPGLFVVNSGGSGGRRRVFSGNAFPTTWDWKRKGVIYTSVGPNFASESTEVDVVAVSLGEDDDPNVSIKKLTVGGENNVFPSPSPDGKWVVFRSGRSGHKNLYIMDAEDGEAGGIRRLTEGPWSDTMCNWSPDGEWIAFASDRDNPGGGSFAIYMVHPNGTGLRRVVHSADGGRTNHPWFSPDSKTLPISNPHHYQPYGEIFTVNIDGSGIRRLTHNSFEDGTPSWTPYYLKPEDVGETPQASGTCAFEDCHWLNIDAQPDSIMCGEHG